MRESFETLRFVVADGVATLTLNRPERLNAFTAAMHAELRVALDSVRAGREAGLVRALVLTGAGRGFCAGQDLSDRQVSADGTPPDLGRSIEDNYKPLVLALRNLELPVIAAVNGVAAGAGANIALACDIVVAARSASFIQSFAKLGLVPDTGGSWILPRLIGPARALGLALLGDRLSAEQAAQWGLIWQCVDDDQLAGTVGDIAAKLAAGPTLGLARTKQAIWSASTRDFSEQLDVERDLMRELGHSEDYREGVAAFMNKRSPAFKGR
ncbi:MAG: 2-(1,2-epoxy-1,2-dihydrophenyl)acetyl-CoA isomerase PaaG [Azoarcus sp.]|jgi:2-(1,2-epoxy-1,2-dihydrophenyl)acetyl-CoA isomerase|nr:2-(1,2-epoxy-1,2-dihydrophenyl)acetyl-CoA isomerase PaaG [Azoarcus sp.]MDX9839114.1 2-(1,2-epoxy-1,2-dihydrophenyl)acetyl-CoA isomerase PaaG [Azoarcus sp.]